MISDLSISGLLLITITFAMNHVIYQSRPHLSRSR
jgi:hypothetical protein